MTGQDLSWRLYRVRRNLLRRDNRPTTVKDLSKELDTSQGKVRVALAEGIQKGIITEVDAPGCPVKAYRLTDPDTVRRVANPDPPRRKRVPRNAAVREEIYTIIVKSEPVTAEKVRESLSETVSERVVRSALLALETDGRIESETEEVRCNLNRIHLRKIYRTVEVSA